MKYLLPVIAGLICVLLFGCVQETAPAGISAQQTATAEADIFHFPIVEQTPMRTPAIQPTVTAVQEAQTVTIGAVGDIAADSRIVAMFYNEATGTYAFEQAYRGMQPLLTGVDLMCGNLETPLAGADAGYSGNARTPNALDKKISAASYAFNAPDELAADLKEVGFDFVSTANNHFSDRCRAGVLRTLDVLDSVGLLHAGTNRSEEERATPCVTQINGIRIGLLSCTNVFNDLYDIHLRSMPYLICALSGRERIEQDVRRCREAGAEIILMFPHWDAEYRTEPTGTTRKQAEWLLSIGVDVIIGSHPHMVQPMEYVTVEREDGLYTGLVVYSLGNSMMRMQSDLRYAQLYVRLTVGRDASGRVVLQDAAYVPTFSAYYDVDGTDYFEVLPAWEDAARIPAAVPGNEAVTALAEKTRAHVLRICGADEVPLLAEPDA